MKLRGRIRRRNKGNRRLSFKRMMEKGIPSKIAARIIQARHRVLARNIEKHFGKITKDLGPGFHAISFPTEAIFPRPKKPWPSPVGITVEGFRFR